MLDPSVAAEIKEECGSVSSSISGSIYMNDITKFSPGLSYSFGSIYNNVVNPRFGN